MLIIFLLLLISHLIDDKKQYKLALKRYKLLSLLRNFIIASMEGKSAKSISNQGIEILYCRPVIDCHHDHDKDIQNDNGDLDTNNDNVKGEKSNEVEYGFSIGLTIRVNKDVDDHDNENEIRNRLSKICKNGILADGLKSIWRLSNEIDSDKIVLQAVDLRRVRSNSNENIIDEIIGK